MSYVDSKTKLHDHHANTEHIIGSRKQTNPQTSKQTNKQQQQLLQRISKIP